VLVFQFSELCDDRLIEKAEVEGDVVGNSLMVWHISANHWVF
jgi:hypothetical protein